MARTTQMSTRLSTATPAQRTPGTWATGLGAAAVFALSIWGVYIVGLIAEPLGLDLKTLGVHPLDVSSLWHIFTAPLLHASLSHLMGNTVPGVIFAFLIGLTGRRAFVEVTAIAVVVGGLGTWFIGGVGTNHIGASGVIYGWLAYLIVRGVFNRSLSQCVLGFILACVYSGWLWGLFPGEALVSWQSHVCGAVGGILAGAIITSDDPIRKTKISSPNV